MCVVFVAGLLKASDVPEFARTLQTWPVVSSVSFGAALLIVNTEIAVGLGWFLGLWRRVSWAVTVASLAGVAIYLAWFLDGSEPPECGCFGPLQAYFSRLESAELLVARNVVLLGLLLTGGALVMSAREQYAAERTPVAVPGHVPRAGFTLVETLLVLALIGVLLSLLLPALSRARGAGRGVVSDSQLRQHSAVFAMYAGIYDDSFPYFVYPDAEAVVRCRTGTVTIQHWSSYSKWNYALAAEFYQGDCAHESFYPPGSGAGGPTPYRYGCSFVARPEYWEEETRRGAGQWGATRVSETVFPANKGLLFSYHPLEGQFRETGNGVARKAPGFVLPIAFVDGHVDRVSLDRITDGYPKGDGDFGGGAHHFVDYPFGLHTLGGVRGRDVE